MARMLLVIADETCRCLLYALLLQWGHTVETSGSYSGAVKKFALTHNQFPYALVIADDCLPETDGGTTLDIGNSVLLVRNILKIKKQHPIHRRWITAYPLYPEIILLSSLPRDVSPLYKYFYQGKAGMKKKPVQPAVTIVQKGTELKKEVEQKVKELEIAYWKRRYKITITGLILSALLGAGIVVKNSIYGFFPSTFIYFLGIGAMYIVLYFFQVKPYHPSRAITGIKQTGERKP